MINTLITDSDRSQRLQCRYTVVIGTERHDVLLLRVVCEETSYYHTILEELLFLRSKLFLWRVLFKYFVTVLPFTSGFISSHLFYLELHFIEVSQIFYFVFYLSLSCILFYYTTIYIDIVQNLFTISIVISFHFISIHSWTVYIKTRNTSVHCFYF